MIGSMEVLIRRIRGELRKIWVNPPPFCRPGASPVTDLLHWEVIIDGPDGSPYAGGTFPVDVDFASTYPLRPPKITFKTKVYHPNIDSRGEMTLDIFHYNNWRLRTSVHELLFLIVSVLYDPMLDGHPVNDEVNDLYESDIELYEQMARAWTCEYSSAPIVSYYPTKKDERWLDEAEERLRLRYNEERRRRRQEEEEVLKRAAASPPARERRIAVPSRVTWKRVVAFLQGWSIALPFATSRRRFSSTVLPLYNYTGQQACF
ncbi:unnamed protein product [Urochloa humidicola]